MYAALSSCRGCSQVLFLGILSPHFYSITLRLRRGVGETCYLLSRCQTCFGRKGGLLPPAPPAIKRNYESIEVQTAFLSALDGGLKLSTRPDVLHLSQDASSTTKSGTTFRKAASKPSGDPSLQEYSRALVLSPCPLPAKSLLAEHDDLPKWSHTRSVGQSVAGRAPGTWVVRSKGPVA